MVKIKSHKTITSCRLCSSKDLKKFVCFGDIPLGNNLLPKKNLAKNAEVYPLQINCCNSCSHFQLSTSVNPNKLYATNYTYLSGIGPSFVKHLNSYAKWAFKKFSLKKESIVVDIGSNDGTALNCFKKLGCNVLGVDPAKKASDIANQNNIPTINSFFDDATTSQILEKYGNVDFITSHNVLAHIEDLDSAFRNIFRLLKPESYFVFEIGYFREVLEKGLFDTTYHEHLDYHHANPLCNYLISLGFDIHEISSNPIQGGTLRIECQKTGNSIIHNRAKDFLMQEKNSILYNKTFLNNWESNIYTSMNSLNSHVVNYQKQKLRIAGYGAPTKITLLMELSKLNEKNIDFILEDNPLKVSKYLPISAIPILSINELHKKKPDIIIIFAWNFAEDIINKLRGLVSWKLKCIIPLPNYREVNL